MLKSIKSKAIFIAMMLSVGGLKSIDLPREVVAEIVMKLVPSQIDDAKELLFTYQAITNYSQINKENYAVLNDPYVLKTIKVAIIKALTTEKAVDHLLVNLNRDKKIKILKSLSDQAKEIKKQISLLKKAIKADNKSELEKFLKQGFASDFKVSNLPEGQKTYIYHSLLNEAINSGHVDLVELLLKEGATQDLIKLTRENFKDPKFGPMLQFLIEKDLLGVKDPFYIRDGVSYYSPFAYAIATHDSGLIEFLMKNGAHYIKDRFTTDKLDPDFVSGNFYGPEETDPYMYSDRTDVNSLIHELAEKYGQTN